MYLRTSGESNTGSNSPRQKLRQTTSLSVMTVPAGEGKGGMVAGVTNLPPTHWTWILPEVEKLNKPAREKYVINNKNNNVDGRVSCLFRVLAWRVLQSRSEWVSVRQCESEWVRMNQTESEWVGVCVCVCVCQCVCVGVSQSESVWVRVSQSESEWVRASQSGS